LTDVWGGEFELKNAQVRSRIKKRTSLRLIWWKWRNFKKITKTRTYTYVQSDWDVW